MDISAGCFFFLCLQQQQDKQILTSEKPLLVSWMLGKLYLCAQRYTFPYGLFPDEPL